MTLSIRDLRVQKSDSQILDFKLMNTLNFKSHLLTKKMCPYAIKKERRHRGVTKLLVLLAVAQDAEEQLNTSSKPRAGAFCYRGLEYLIKYLLIRWLEVLVFHLAFHHICQGIYQRQELVKLKRLAFCLENLSTTQSTICFSVRCPCSKSPKACSI